MKERIDVLQDLIGQFEQYKIIIKEHDIRSYALAHGFVVRLKRLCNVISRSLETHHEEFDFLLADANNFLRSQQ
jgi:hypothetical protein